MGLSNDTVANFDRWIDWPTSMTPRGEFLERVDGDPMRIKYGADITAPTLHLGHAVNLRVMREMQDMGHRVVFLLGGFTTLVGDPTDKLQARTAPEIKQIEDNQAAFISQVRKILNFEDPELIEVRNNTEWWGGVEQEGTLEILDMFRLLGNITLNELLARDMFRKRQEQGQPIQMSEFLYPVLQGYDSVMVESDITVIGSDQLFNESMGRGMQAKAGQDKQLIVCTKVTPGLNGGPKQSKSLGNYVGIAHSPEEMYSRLMLLKDELTDEWLQVYSSFTQAEIQVIVVNSKDPIELKRHLAMNVTTMFHGEGSAIEAEQDFNRKLRGEAPLEFVELIASEGDSFKQAIQKLGHKTGSIVQFINDGSLTITIEGNNLELSNIADLNVPAISGAELKIGKRKYYKIIINPKD